MKSIISNQKKCAVCGTTYNLHRHHIYFNAKRKVSEQYGCWCWLCAKHHNMSDEGVHFNKELDLKLKRLAQKRFNEVYSDLDFTKIFFKNYLI